MTNYVPSRDGIDHINIFSRGETELGRLLTNFAHTPFDHPSYGHFESVEGAWHFYKTGCIEPELRKLYGYKAKEVGKSVAEKATCLELDTSTEEFKAKILSFNRCKLNQNRNILNMMYHSDLPFTHYYYYGAKENPKVEYLPWYQWQVDYFEKVRTWLKEKHE